MRASEDESPATMLMRMGPEVSAFPLLSALTAGLERKCEVMKSDMINDPYKGCNKATTSSKLCEEEWL